MSTLGREALNPTLVCFVWLLGALGAVGVPGCALDGPRMTPGAQFTLGAVSQNGPVAAAAAGVVRVHGVATVPTTMRDLLNVQDGRVSGTPVEVRDALSGRQMAKGVTYYDGSFLVEVPCQGAQRSAVVAIDLVAKDDPTRKVSLQAPVLLRQGQGDTTVTLTPGSTALVAFLFDVSTLDAGSGGAKQLSDMIATFAPADQSAFASLAESSPEIRQASTLEAFESGIRQYVGRLRGRASSVPRFGTTATLAAANGL